MLHIRRKLHTEYLDGRSGIAMLVRAARLNGFEVMATRVDELEVQTVYVVHHQRGHAFASWMKGASTGAQLTEPGKPVQHLGVTELRAWINNREETS